MDQSSYLTEDEALVDIIERVGSRVSFSGSKQDAAHAEFLMEIIEDMEAQVASIRYRKAN